MDHGRVVYAGGIHSALVDPVSPLAHDKNAVAMLEAIVIKHDSDYRVSTVQTSSGNHFILQGKAIAGRKVRLLIRASDVSLCLHKPEATSILNVIEGCVTDIEVDVNKSVSLRVDCSGDYILAKITSLSLSKLGLSIGNKVYVQIKAVSIKDA